MFNFWPKNGTRKIAIQGRRSGISACNILTSFSVLHSLCSFGYVEYRHTEVCFGTTNLSSLQFKPNQDMNFPSALNKQSWTLQNLCSFVGPYRPTNILGEFMTSTVWWFQGFSPHKHSFVFTSKYYREVFCRIAPLCIKKTLILSSNGN